MAEKSTGKKETGTLSKEGPFTQEKGASDPYLNELDSSIEDMISEEPTSFDIPAEAPVPEQEPAPAPEEPAVPEQEEEPREAVTGLEAAAGIPVQVHVVIGNKRTTLLDLLSLKKGEIVELEKGIDTTVDLMVQDKVIARGELVEVEGRLGVRLIQIAEEKP